MMMLSQWLTMPELLRAEKALKIFLPGHSVKPEGAPKNYSTIAAESQEKIAKKIDKKILSQNSIFVHFANRQTGQSMLQYNHRDEEGAR